MSEEMLEKRNILSFYRYGFAFMLILAMNLLQTSCINNNESEILTDSKKESEPIISKAVREKRILQKSRYIYESFESLFSNPSFINLPYRPETDFPRFVNAEYLLNYIDDNQNNELLVFLLRIIIEFKSGYGNMTPFTQYMIKEIPSEVKKIYRAKIDSQRSIRDVFKIKEYKKIEEYIKKRNEFIAPVNSMLVSAEDGFLLKEFDIAWVRENIGEISKEIVFRVPILTEGELILCEKMIFGNQKDTSITKRLEFVRRSCFGNNWTEETVEIAKHPLEFYAALAQTNPAAFVSQFMYNSKVNIRGYIGKLFSQSLAEATRAILPKFKDRIETIKLKIIYDEIERSEELANLFHAAAAFQKREIRISAPLARATLAGCWKSGQTVSEYYKAKSKKGNVKRQGILSSILGQELDEDKAEIIIMKNSLSEIERNVEQFVDFDIEERKESEYFRYIINNPRGATSDDIEGIIDIFESCVINNIIFILSHELAHFYLPPDASIDDHFAADCIADYSLSNNNLSRGEYLQFPKEVLLNAVRTGQFILFGLKGNQVSSIEDRFHQIENGQCGLLIDELLQDGAI